ncbi:MAG TPA: hypothetical protein VNS34_08980 [Rhizobiaceae bacterium]|nr:hypothetical protein [Rhizobiaceae bacterium]
MIQSLRTGVSWAGLLAGPLAWALSTQLNYALVSWQCAHELPVIPLVALALVLICLAGGVLSWRALRLGGASFRPDRTIGTERFLALIGILSALLFGLVVLMQGAASLVLDSCIR